MGKFCIQCGTAYNTNHPTLCPNCSGEAEVNPVSSYSKEEIYMDAKQTSDTEPSNVTPHRFVTQASILRNNGKRAEKVYTDYQDYFNAKVKKYRLKHNWIFLFVNIIFVLIPAMLINHNFNLGAIIADTVISTFKLKSGFLYVTMSVLKMASEDNVWRIILSVLLAAIIYSWIVNKAFARISKKNIITKIISTIYYMIVYLARAPFTYVAAAFRFIFFQPVMREERFKEYYDAGLVTEDTIGIDWDLANYLKEME